MPLWVSAGPYDEMTAAAIKACADAPGPAAIQTYVTAPTKRAKEAAQANCKSKEATYSRQPQPGLFAQTSRRR